MNRQENRAVADQLADVRAEISRLQVIEQRLRKEIVSSGEPVVRGDENAAVVTSFTSRRLDTEALRAELGEEAVGPFMRETETTMVRVFRLKGPSRAEWAMLKDRDER
jgi:hypothetical protein